MKGYQAHESFLTDLKMHLQLVRIGIAIGLILQIIFIFISFMTMYKHLTGFSLPGGSHMPNSAVTNYLFSFEASLNLPSRQITIEPELKYLFKNQQSQFGAPSNIYTWVLDQSTHYAFAREKQGFLQSFPHSFWMYLFSLLYVVFFMICSHRTRERDFIRGTDLVPIHKLNQILQKEAVKEEVLHLQVGKTIIPYVMEPKHIAILGAVGTGKGVLLNQIIHQIYVRNEQRLIHNPLARVTSKAIIYDMKGEFISKQARSGDYIFSPFDKRGLKWSLFNEIQNYPDLDIVAKSLYNSPDQRDEYWYNCAKDIFRTGLYYLRYHNLITNRDIWNFFSQPLSKIKEAFESLPLDEQSALKHIDKSDSNQSASIISILQERLQFFKYLKDMDGPFSFRKYINSNQDASLYLLNIEQYKTIFKPLMTFAMDTLIREILSMEDDSERRVFFIIDELGSLYRLESILDLLTVGRSKGACLICANQDLGRIEEAYGRANLTTFYNNFNTNFIFRVNEPKTADFLSQAIGEREIMKKVQSRQMSPSDVGDRKGISEQNKIERVVLATEFQNLADFEAIVKIANYGIAKTKIPQIFFNPRVPHFIRNDFAEKPNNTGVEAARQATAVSRERSESPNRCNEANIAQENIEVKIPYNTNI